MVRRIESVLNASGHRFAIVAARFNRPLVELLVGAAIECLTRHGCDEESIEVIYVPGSFELPQGVSVVAKRGGCDAIIALSVLIRGETPHFDHLSRVVTGALSRVGIEHGVPVAYGVITADTLEQAQVRAGVKSAGKGWDAAMAAIEMAGLTSALKSGRRRR
jgi:6,7-dimethyl-8-ribityllumazine synthase